MSHQRREYSQEEVLAAERARHKEDDGNVVGRLSELHSDYSDDRTDAHHACKATRDDL